MSRANWARWESEARKAEKQALELDLRAHSFPIRAELFLQAAKIARKSARYYELAVQSTSDRFQQSVSLANHYINLGNSYKSLGNFFYYSEQPLRAARFFERAAHQYALSDSHTPASLGNYADFIKDSAAHQVELWALVADCKGKDAKLQDNWTEALNYFIQEKRNWRRLVELEGDYGESVNRKALIESAEREIQICRLVISLRNKDFAAGIEHAESALAAAEKAFQEEPRWFGYKKALTSAISLRESVKVFTSVLKQAGITNQLVDRFQHLSERTEQHVNNLVTYKFEREVESYFRRELQYMYASCRYKPPYLGREIDVFASKGQQRTTITVCECRLRFNNRPIDGEEISKFSELASNVRKYEKAKAAKEGRKVTIHAWFVTNADTVEKDAIVIAKKNNIKIKRANVPKGREQLIKDTSWQVSDINDLQ